MVCWSDWSCDRWVSTRGRCLFLHIHGFLSRLLSLIVLNLGPGHKFKNKKKVPFNYSFFMLVTFPFFIYLPSSAGSIFPIHLALRNQAET